MCWSLLEERRAGHRTRRHATLEPGRRPDARYSLTTRSLFGTDPGDYPSLVCLQLSYLAFALPQTHRAAERRHHARPSSSSPKPAIPGAIEETCLIGHGGVPGTNGLGKHRRSGALMTATVAMEHLGSPTFGRPPHRSRETMRLWPCRSPGASAIAAAPGSAAGCRGCRVHRRRDWTRAPVRVARGSAGNAGPPSSLTPASVPTVAARTAFPGAESPLPPAMHGRRVPRGAAAALSGVAATRPEFEESLRHGTGSSSTSRDSQIALKNSRAPPEPLALKLVEPPGPSSGGIDSQRYWSRNVMGGPTDSRSGQGPSARGPGE